MGEKSSSKPKLRALTFAITVVLVGSLMVGLFQEAAGVEGKFINPPGQARGLTTFLVEFTTDAGERVPFQAIDAVIEKQASGRTDKVNAEFVSRVSCPFSVKGSCVGAELKLKGGTPDVITAITSLGAFSRSAADNGGNVPTGYEVPPNSHFTFGDREGTKTGYGYDTVSPVFDAHGYGYGYGHETGDTANVDFGEGYGYGSDDTKIHFLFRVTVAAHRLSPGVHYLTVLADTGSQIVSGGTATSSSGSVDVGLVLDESGSMGFTTVTGTSTTLMEAAKENATKLVDRLDSTDQSGLVSFASSATLRQALTTVHQDTKDAINALTAGGGTRIDLGIDESKADFDNNGRSGASPIMVVLSDGVSSGDPPASAQIAKDAGIEIFSIAFGGGADKEEMWRVASEPKRDHWDDPPISGDHFFFAEEDDLTTAFDAIAQSILQIKTSAAVYSTPWTAFTAQPGGGGGGGGPGPGATGQQIGNNGNFNANTGNRITVNNGLPPGINQVSFNLAQNCNGCTFSLNFHAGAPPGAPGAAPGTNILQYLTIVVRDANGNVLDNAVTNGEIEFDQPGPPATAQNTVMLRANNNQWDVLPTQCGGGSCTAQTPGFSVFAIATDVSGPLISSPGPTGTISQVTPVISASWTDNREVDPGSLDLTIDGELHGHDTGTLTADKEGFEYIPGTAFGLGEHTVRVNVSDVSGVSTEETWSFNVVDVVCDPPPTILSTTPADGASNVDPTQPVEVTLEIGACEIVSHELTVNGRTVPTTLEGSTITATLSASVVQAIGGDTVDARIVVVDTGDNQAAKSWSYETQQAPPPEDGEVEDGGMGAWVWVVIVLVLVAAIGGWYWWDQQRKQG